MEQITVEIEIKMAGSEAAAERVARKAAQKRNPSFTAVAVRNTRRRGSHGGFMFEVDLDEGPARI